MLNVGSPIFDINSLRLTQLIILELLALAIITYCSNHLLPFYTYLNT